MPVYAWKGLNAAGKNVSGTKDADGPKVLRQMLRKDGVFITEHREMLAGGGKAPAKSAGAPTGETVPFWKREVNLEGLLGGLVARVFFLISMCQGFGAIRALKQEEAEAESLAGA